MTQQGKSEGELSEPWPKSTTIPSPGLVIFLTLSAESRLTDRYGTLSGTDLETNFADNMTAQNDHNLDS